MEWGQGQPVTSLTRVTRNRFVIISRTLRDRFLLQHILCRCSRSSESITFPSLYNLLFRLYIVPRVQGNVMLWDSYITRLKLNRHWSVLFFSCCVKADLDLILKCTCIRIHPNRNTQNEVQIDTVCNVGGE